MKLGQGGGLAETVAIKQAAGDWTEGYPPIPSTFSIQPPLEVEGGGGRHYDLASGQAGHSTCERGT